MDVKAAVRGSSATSRAGPLSPPRAQSSQKTHTRGLSYSCLPHAWVRRFVISIYLVTDNGHSIS